MTAADRNGPVTAAGPACPDGPDGLRAWLRHARREDFLQLLREDPSALRRFSPIAALVETRVLTLPDRAGSALEVACTASAAVHNPWGHIHGGTLLALMDEVASAAAALHVGPSAFAATTTLSASFIRPLRQTAFRLAANVLGRSLSACTVQVRVEDEHGTLHDAAIATFALRPSALGEIGIGIGSGDLA